MAWSFGGWIFQRNTAQSKVYLTPGATFLMRGMYRNVELQN